MIRVALWFSIACVCTALQAPAEEADLRVLIYNIHHGEGIDEALDLERIARVIRDAEADLILLQEIDRNLPRTQRQDFPDLFSELLDMPVFFEPNLHWLNGEYGNATMTRLEVVEHENLALPNPHEEEPRGALRVTVRVNGQEVDVWNTHFGLKSDERAAQADCLAAHLRDVPTIVGGDLNEIISSSPLKPLLNALRSTASEIGGTGGTVPAVRPLRRIDHILVSDHFEVESDKVIMTPETQVASDHLPCLAVVRLKAAEVKPES